MPASPIHPCGCVRCQQEIDRPEEAHSKEDHPDIAYHHYLNLVLSRLDEQQRRWFVALESMRENHGTDTELSLITGMDEKTIRRGREELQEGLASRPANRVRRRGGGRPLAEKKSPEIIGVLDEVVAPQTAGDPMSDQKWTRNSLQQIAVQMEQMGFAISAPTVGAILRDQRYSLKANLKKREGAQSPDRDRQFVWIEAQIKRFREAGLPVISADTKKKELIGNFKNPGKSWCKKAQATNVHDFRSDSLGRAVPYGIYDITSHQGYVYIGTSADTSEFAVDAITMWWEGEGKQLYPQARELLLLVDGGGSNNHTYWLFKQQLQEKLSDGCGLMVSVMHYPTGCSKWNPIEHKLFGPISINWAAVPLRSFEIMKRLIQDTTQTGLEVKALVLKKVYDKGIKIPKEVQERLNFTRHYICPQWNYTFAPAGLSPLDSLSFPRYPALPAPAPAPACQDSSTEVPAVHTSTLSAKISKTRTKTGVKMAPPKSVISKVEAVVPDGAAVSTSERAISASSIRALAMDNQPAKAAPAPHSSQAPVCHPKSIFKSPFIKTICRSIFGKLFF